MTAAIAIMALVAISIGLSLGNYWFTFGLWPTSWGAFVFFAVSQIVVSALIRLVGTEKSK